MLTASEYGYAVGSSDRIAIRSFRVERDWLRVGGLLRSPIFITMVALALVAFGAATSGATVFLLPIAIGFLRNRPMSSIILWDVLLGFVFVGWLMSLCKALGSR